VVAITRKEIVAHVLSGYAVRDLHTTLYSP
jgi:hypothetical protein